MKQKVLAVGAHPDDIEIGCGGTMKKHILDGDTVHYVIATNGEKGGNSIHRVEEAKKAASIMGVESVYFLGLPDGYVSHDCTTVTLLDRLISEFSPTIVYVHSLRDYHQDHSTIARATLSASRNMHNSIFFYEAPSTTHEFIPIAFKDISNTFESKIDCISQFCSQEKKSYVERQAVINLAQFRGKMISTEYAEAFEVVRLIDW